MRNGVDFSQIEKLRKNIAKLSDTQLEAYNEQTVKELAARLLAKVIKRTPVGQYTGTVSFNTSDGTHVEFHSSASDGKQGGALRRGWTAKALEVKKIGNMYQIEIINPMEYASYVEYGHRTANHKGWVPGQFMLTLSETELNRQAPVILEAKLRKLLGGVFDDA